MYGLRGVSSGPRGEGEGGIRMYGTAQGWAPLPLPGMCSVTFTQSFLSHVQPQNKKSGNGRWFVCVYMFFIFDILNLGDGGSWGDESISHLNRLV